MPEFISSNTASIVATVGLCLYFMFTAIAFMIKPKKFAAQYSILPKDAAGVTEIRVYYGGISFALGLFLAVLAFVFQQPFYSLVGGLIFANTVFFSRFIFTFVDKAWKCAYTKLALPVEALFIIALWTCFIIAVVAEGAV